MTHDEINCNDEFDEISVDENDEIFNYTIVSNLLIRDSTISPNARWMVIYLLSNAKGWKIKLSQLCNHTKGFLGRDLTRKIFKECINAGYIEMKQIFRKNPRGGFLNGVTYKVSSTPKFKKCFQHTENQYAGDPYPGNQDHKEITSKELSKNNNSLKVLSDSDQSAKADVQAKACDENLESSSKHEEIKTKKKRIDDLPPEVLEVADHFIECLKKSKPNYLPPRNLSAFLTQIDLLMRLDQRSRDLIIQVLSWALADSFWCAKLYKQNPAEYLRKNFDQLEMAMKSKPTAFKSFAKVDRRTKNQDGTPVDAPWLKDLF